MNATLHPSATIDCETIGDGSTIWAYTHILEGAIIGKNCQICDHCFIEGGSVIGDNVTIKNSVSIWTGIRIADDVFIGPNVCFTNDKYPRSPRAPLSRQHYQLTENWLCHTKVGQGVSIGANATILPGITLEPYAVIGAGAVVCRDVPAHAVVVGNPAKLQCWACCCGAMIDVDIDHGCGACTACAMCYRIDREALTCTKI